MIVKKFNKLPTDDEYLLKDLLEVQISSYRDFLQKDIPPEKREPKGLQGIFLEIFPIEDNYQRYKLEFISYRVGEPNYTPEDAVIKNVSYTAPLLGKFRLIFQEQKETLKEAIEQDVYICDLPLMTEKGTFIINGIERVVINQLRRAPGIYLGDRIHSSGRRLFVSEIIPYRGPWITISTDINDILWITITKKAKILATVILKALGYETLEQILPLFFETQTLSIEKAKDFILARDIKNEDGLIARAGEPLDYEIISYIKRFGINKVEVIKEKNVPFIIPTFLKDNIASKKDALFKLHSLLKGTSTQNIKVAWSVFNNMFFDKARYNLHFIGRKKINERFGTNESQLALTPQDFINAIKGIILLAQGKEKPDDLDHIENKHIRRICEMLEDQFRIALLKLSWTIKQEMVLKEVDKILPKNLINPRIINDTLSKFFGTSPLSQFLDQTNPLAEITHKRRITRFGPGGLTKETAGLEARDVHYSHYGRMCPVETPEGQNIGIITSLGIYARVNMYGEIELPYYKVNNGKITKEIKYLTPADDDKNIIAQANVAYDENGKITQNLVLTRKKGDFAMVSPKDVDYIDVSPTQLLGISASLIPFFEHNDANRVLTGANMQRQAVPLLFNEPPLVTTGIEKIIAENAGISLTAKRKGKVIKADANEIIIRTEDKDEPFDYYLLKKFKRSNQDTSINERPIVKNGDIVEEGDIIADGPAISEGKLALGKNVLVAFMPWKGYNFEDAIVISESLLEKDTFTSVTVQEYELEVRDTEVGPEEVTKDIPNVTPEDVAKLDENGIVYIGAEVEGDDILVGKISPKGERELSPEERLLQAIFGERAKDVKDSSLRLPPGVRGKVIDVKILSRVSNDSLFKEKIDARKKEIRKKYSYLIKKIKKEKEETKIKNAIISALKDKANKEIKDAEKGDTLPYGVLKIIKVYVAQRRPIVVGDKLAGRHGNKGSIAKILPKEDMPYLEDGTPIEIILNPLGVPSRMNIGQILETQLGWAAKLLGYEAVSPVFNGASINEIKEELKKAGLPEDGKAILYDGQTGEPFKEKVTVGYIYMMKLIHMVEDKIHARSIGPYTLITQQPLGGKAQFGGQRFGEMEVWALEAYGAAHTLQEMLTVKSDDVVGRKDMYEAIIKGTKFPEPKSPTSFKVLIKELNALCLETKSIKGEENGN